MSDISKNAEKQINGHPWEIIYKYLALIMLSNDCKKEFEVKINADK